MTATMRGALALAAALAVGLGGCAATGLRGAPESPEETALKQAVEGLLDQHPELRPPSLVYVQVRGHLVVLSGLVSSEYARRLAESTAREAAGVTDVSNFLGVDNVPR
jgi:osmotically-inducible protein OsmY